MTALPVTSDAALLSHTVHMPLSHTPTPLTSPLTSRWGLNALYLSMLLLGLSPLPVTTIIPAKEDAVKVLDKFLADVSLSGAIWYTDGSLLDGSAGWATIRMEKGVVRERIVIPLGAGQVAEGETEGLGTSSVPRVLPRSLMARCRFPASGVLATVTWAASIGARASHALFIFFLPRHQFQPMSKPQESFGTTGVVSNDASIASLAYSDSASEIENSWLTRLETASPSSPTLESDAQALDGVHSPLQGLDMEITAISDPVSDHGLAEPMADVTSAALPIQSNLSAYSSVSGELRSGRLTGLDSASPSIPTHESEAQASDGLDMEIAAIPNTGLVEPMAAVASTALPIHSNLSAVLFRNAPSLKTRSDPPSDRSHVEKSPIAKDLSARVPGNGPNDTAPSFAASRTAPNWFDSTTAIATIQDQSQECKGTLKRCPTFTGSVAVIHAGH
ncbi:hypothetical protein B0H14DRAFT_3579822 [Mycena olivaceomarginata]|nr:hypothetical protein B0H14DRAFT_3579822 [Mycena olivaceomarginata]